MKRHPAFSRMGKRELLKARNENLEKARGMRGGMWDHLVSSYVSAARSAHHYLCGFKETI